MLLDKEPGIEVIAEANDGWEAVQLTRQLSPDVVVMDITMMSDVNNGHETYHAASRPA